MDKLHAEEVGEKIKDAGHDAGRQMDKNDEAVQSKISPRYAKIVGRIGFVTKGIVYIIIGALAMTACWSSSGPTPDKSGVVQFLAGQTGGVWILWVLIVGLYSYSLWRFYEVISGISDNPEKKRWKRILTKRMLPLYSAILYAYFATSIVITLTSENGGSGNGSGDTKQQWSVKILNSPGGIAFFIIIGILFFLIGLNQLWKAVKGKFRKNLKIWEIPTWAKRVVIVLGYAGMIGRALCFWLIAYVYWKTAGDHQLRDLGLGGALGELQSHPAGKAWLFVISVLLLCFGTYSLILAKYKDFYKYAKTRV